MKNATTLGPRSQMAAVAQSPMGAACCSRGAACNLSFPLACFTHQCDPLLLLALEFATSLKLKRKNKTKLVFRIKQYVECAFLMANLMTKEKYI